MVAQFPDNPRSRYLAIGIIAGSGLDDEAFLLSGEMDRVIADLGIGTFGSVTEAVLITQLLFDLRVDFVDWLFA
jgi:hypothetical protein